jgi:protein-disulfide isomerase
MPSQPTTLVWTAAVLSLGALLLAVPVRAADTPVAKVGDRTITQAELQKHVRGRLIQLEQERYEALREGLDELIGEALVAQEAKAKEVTPEALEKQEITGKVGEPTAAEIQELYDANKEELDSAPLEAVKPRLVEYLTQIKTAQRRQEYLRGLKEKYQTTVSLRPPVVDVGTGGRPTRGGGENAPVTVIEFSDYECPFCQRTEATVSEVLKHYGDRVRFVYRDYPLDFHPNAKRASLAAHCAQAQGKFWEYHDKLFIRRELEEEKLKSLAGELGLDQKAFDECLDKEQFKDAVEEDRSDGASAGVTGTPTFFINGRFLPGAVPFEDLKRVIDEELARVKGAKS